MSALPRVKITARSIKFSNSRMCPGHSQAVRPSSQPRELSQSLLHLFRKFLDENISHRQEKPQIIPIHIAHLRIPHLQVLRIAR
jgi:hypothetical protein